MKTVVGHAFLPDDFDIQKARDDDRLYVIKTHGLPEYKGDKVIYLIRDGRESILSYMHYLKDFGKQKKSLADVIHGNVPFGAWDDHVQAWSPKNRKHTLLIRFEELVDHPQAYIESVAHFISQEVIGGDIPTFMDLKKINTQFFRSGNKKGWKQEFSNNDHLEFWSKNYQVMRDYGYAEGVSRPL